MKAATLLLVAASALLTSARELQQYDYAPKSPPAQTYQSPPAQTYQSPPAQTYQSPPAQTYSPPPYYPPYSYTPAPPADLEQWQKDALAWVNKYYRWGGKWPLNWDYNLKASCDASAYDAANKYYYVYNKYPGEYDYNQLPAWGETAYKFTPSPQYGNKPGWQVAAEYWYSEGANYQNAYSPQTSNYTQLTWKASTGWWICSAKDQYNNVYYYAHYYPPGNVKGYYSSNVPTYAPVDYAAATGK